ncbi:flagellar motor protein PomA [Hahella sp. CCB-MM4]|uniref:motility protein A n=1 Tax=Hahella sp. (strain CCB-MM4) TaxID=1926491 RepID=UPI000B9B22A8|nr:MotA/TolQ/ExbB proton channel family protein [Hahella sp. CCB-MM4]OZG73262.1 flagellar motor protein PomA [Hahella sp. CCB-MM4]
MDIMTWVGLLTGIGVVLGAVASGSNLLDFFNLPGLMIVLFGTFAVTLVKFRWKNFAGSIRLALSTVFTDKLDDPVSLYLELKKVAEVVRKQGLLGLDDLEIEHDFLRKAVMFSADGHHLEFVEEVLLEDTQQTIERLQTAERVFRGIGEAAPALGMLGTLVGLVQMLNNMQEPSSIGPAMAIALLTTFYGAFIAQLVALPLADKLLQKTQDELRNRMIVTSSMLSMLRGQNPRVLKDIVSSYIPGLLEMPEPSPHASLTATREE